MTEEQAAQFIKTQEDIKAQLAGMPTKDDYLHLLTAVHDIAAKFSDHDEDHKMTDNILERHEGWFKRLAQSTDTRLT